MPELFVSTLCSALIFNYGKIFSQNPANHQFFLLARWHHIYAETAFMWLRRVNGFSTHYLRQCRALRTLTCTINSLKMCFRDILVRDMHPHSTWIPGCYRVGWIHLACWFFELFLCFCFFCMFFTVVILVISASAVDCLQRPCLKLFVDWDIKLFKFMNEKWMKNKCFIWAQWHE